MRILCFEINYVGFNPLERQVKSLIATGDIIAAIKLVKEKRGYGLKEAKDYVDKFRTPISLS